jgi:hypothetical protein
MENEIHVRTELSVAPPVSGGHQHRDLIQFAGFCAARIARGLRGIDAWDVFVAGGLDGQADAIVRVRVGVETIEARASACDPAYAIWNAMCRVEQPVREAAATRRAA